MDEKLYRLIPEEGKHLAESNDTEGAYRGVYLDDETNKPCGAGEFVEVDPEDLFDREESDPSTSGDVSGAAALLGLGALIGIGAYKAYPRVKGWVVDTAVPQVKHLWRKVFKKEAEIEVTQLPATVKATESSDSTVLSIDVVLNDYRENMTSEEAQRELIEAFLLYLASARKLTRVANANVVDSEGKIIDGKALIEMMTDEKLLESINSVIRSNPALLNPQQMSTLADILGYEVFKEKEYIPITAKALEEGLMRASDE